MKEYQVYLLDPRYKLVTKGKPLLETNNLVDALNYSFNNFFNNGREIAVWQPRTKSFRDYYKHPIKIPIFRRIK